MVEKIIINPNKVRGYGNIMMSHSSSDYELEDCTISTGTDTVNGATVNVMTLTPTFSHSYSLSFGSSSYTQTGGSVSVSATLTDYGTAVSGATITFTGGSSTVTATTNSSGVATATVSFTSSGTCTATYGSVSDTASITVSSYLFYDDCSSSSGLSNYGTLHNIGNTTSTGTLSYDSTKNAYKFSPTNVATTGFVDIPIPSMDNKNNYYIQAEIYTDDTSTGGQSGLVLYPSTDTGGNGVFFRDIASLNRCGVLKFANYSENGESGNSQQSGLPVAENWYRIRLEVSGTSVKGIWLKTDGTQVYTHTYTVPYTSGAMRVGLAFLANSTSKYYYVKNIVAEAI